MCKDKSRPWNTVELHHLYQVFRRTNLSPRSLISQLKCHFLDKISILSSCALSSLVVFRDDTLNVLSLVSDYDDDRETAAIDSLAKQLLMK